MSCIKTFKQICTKSSCCLWTVKICSTEKFWSGLVKNAACRTPRDKTRNKQTHKQETSVLTRKEWLKKPWNKWLKKIEKWDFYGEVCQSKCIKWCMLFNYKIINGNMLSGVGYLYSKVAIEYFLCGVTLFNCKVALRGFTMLNYKVLFFSGLEQVVRLACDCGQVELFNNKKGTYVE